MHAAQVVFAVQTTISADLALLDVLLAAHPGEYRKADIAFQQDDHSAHARQHAGMAPGRPYVKIDDDIVFIQVLLREGSMHACSLAHACQHMHASPLLCSGANCRHDAPDLRKCKENAVSRLQRLSWPCMCHGLMGCKEMWLGTVCSCAGRCN